MKFAFIASLVMVGASIPSQALACSAASHRGQLVYDSVAPKKIPEGMTLLKIRADPRQENIVKTSPGDLVYILAEILEGDNAGTFVAISVIKPVCGYLVLPLAGIGYVIGQYLDDRKYKDSDVGSVPIFIRRYRPPPTKRRRF